MSESVSDAKSQRRLGEDLLRLVLGTLYNQHELDVVDGVTMPLHSSKLFRNMLS